MGGDVVGRSTKTEKTIINTVTLANQDGKYVYTGLAPYPKTPSKGDRWIEYDSSNNFVETWIWNGYYWLSSQKYFSSITNDVSATLEIPLSLDFAANNLFLNKIKASYKVAGTNSTSKYWKLHLYHVDNSNTWTYYGSIDTSTATGNIFNVTEFDLNFHIDTIQANTRCYMIQIERISSPSAIRLNVALSYSKARR